MAKRKCPCCNSTKINENVLDGFHTISCKNCGYINKVSSNSDDKMANYQINTLPKVF